MKKALLLLIIPFGLSLSAHAQTQQPEYYKPAQPGKAIAASSEEYVQVLLTPTDWGKSYKGQLEFGDKIISMEEYLKKEPKKERTYPTTVAVMNAMNEMGWEFVQYIPDAEGRLDRDRFLMKRKLVKA